MKIRKSRLVNKQLWAGQWVALGRYELHECCGCGLVHAVQFRYNKRLKRFEEQWIPVNQRSKPKHVKRKKSRR
jgi:hypothetical protein